MFLGQRNELLVIDGTGSDQDHTICSVVGLDVVGEIVTFDRENIGFRAKDGSAERLTWWKISLGGGDIEGRGTNLGKQSSGGGRKRPLLTACQPPAAPSV